jgi:putative PIG3 family NAD(P)H quinone oxidoreductase
MRAIVVREPGDPDVLELREVPDPVLPFGHVGVRVRYAGVNRADLMQRRGLYPAPPGAPQDIPGLEVAGVVDALGDGTSRFRLGDRVYGVIAGGGYAELVVVHERELVPIPASITDEEAAAIPEAFVTAYDALIERGRMTPGDQVLIHAAGSGVGTAGVQIVKALGARAIGTSRTREKLDRCRALGLDVGIVPEANTFADAVLEATSGRGVDVVLDLVGGGYLTETMRAAAPRARVVVVGLTAGARAEIDLRLLLQKRIELIGTVLRSRPLEEKIAAASLLDRRIGPLVEARSLRPVVDAVFPLASASEAHRRLETDATFGKLLLQT